MSLFWIFRLKDYEIPINVMWAACLIHLMLLDLITLTMLDEASNL
jgi:hypothetical protein